MSMIPSQKWGTESPESATRLAVASITVPRREAEITPAGMPIASAMSIEPMASSTVTGSLAGEQLGHRDPVAQRLAEIAAQQLAHPDGVLHRGRPIEMVASPDRRHRDRIVLLAGERQGGVAGQELLQREDQHRDEEQRRHQHGHPARNVERQRHQFSFSPLQANDAVGVRA